MTAVKWDRVDALIDASPGLARPAGTWASSVRGAPLARVREAAALPASSARSSQATWRTHAAPRVLAEIRAACDGPIMLVKGPAVAARFPDPATRPFVDLDLLVPDAQAAQAALLGAGFRLSGDPADYPAHLHHLPPLHSPADPIPVEVHSRLKWVDGLQAPTLRRPRCRRPSRALWASRAS